MKRAAGKLYLLLSACLPANERVLTHLTIEEILESKEYSELSAQSASKPIMSKMYTKDILSALSLEELKNIKRCLPLIHQFFSILPLSVRSGQAWRLTESDFPNFSSPESLGRVIDKIKKTTNTENFTNISDQNVLQIFEKSTIKTIDAFFDHFDHKDIKQILSLAPNVLANQSYCIDRTALMTKIGEIDATISEVKAEEEKEHLLKKTYLSRKFQIVFFVLGLLAFLSSQQLLTHSGMIIMGLASLVILIIFVIVG